MALISKTLSNGSILNAKVQDKKSTNKNSMKLNVTDTSVGINCFVLIYIITIKNIINTGIPKSSYLKIGIKIIDDIIDKNI
ncbi:hypothetical protein [Gottschalkia acidurici]|uniref:hypothetical protein n=1 Tax=Clostridium acidurici TaxID=1556 RepID=UPI00068716AE|nr:hypothetical protein [Gottschalkia acidurici]